MLPKLLLVVSRSDYRSCSHGPRQLAVIPWPLESGSLQLSCGCCAACRSCTAIWRRLQVGMQQGAVEGSCFGVYVIQGLFEGSKTSHVHAHDSALDPSQKGRDVRHSITTNILFTSSAWEVRQQAHEGRTANPHHQTESNSCRGASVSRGSDCRSSCFFFDSSFQHELGLGCDLTTIRDHLPPTLRGTSGLLVLVACAGP